MIDNKTKIYRSILQKHIINNSIDYIHWIEGPLRKDSWILSMIRCKNWDNNFTEVKKQAECIAKKSRYFKTQQALPLSYLVFKAEKLKKNDITINLCPIPWAPDHVDVDFTKYDEILRINILKLLIDEEIIN